MQKTKRYFFLRKIKKPKKAPMEVQNPNKYFYCGDLWGLQEHVKDLHKVGGRNTLAAQVPQKGQGLALHTRGAGWERGCYVLSSQAPVIKRRTIYFKGLTELVAWMAEKQQVQGKWEGPVKQRQKKPPTKPNQHPYAKNQEASLLGIQWENELAKSSKVPRSVSRASFA